MQHQILEFNDVGQRLNSRFQHKVFIFSRKVIVGAHIEQNPSEPNETIFLFRVLKDRSWTARKSKIFILFSCFRVNRYQKQFSLDEKLERWKYEESKLDFIEVSLFLLQFYHLIKVFNRPLLHIIILILRQLFDVFFTMTSIYIFCKHISSLLFTLTPYA